MYKRLVSEPIDGISTFLEQLLPAGARNPRRNMAQEREVQNEKFSRGEALRNRSKDQLGQGNIFVILPSNGDTVHDPICRRNVGAINTIKPKLHEL